jgi:hypothetical protein
VPPHQGSSTIYVMSLYERARSMMIAVHLTATLWTGGPANRASFGNELTTRFIRWATRSTVSMGTMQTWLSVILGVPGACERSRYHEAQLGDELGSGMFRFHIDVPGGSGWPTIGSR